MKPAKLEMNAQKKNLRHRIKLYEEPQSVQCDDLIHYCPDTYSCCVKKQKGTTSYGCCPG